MPYAIIRAGGHQEKVAPGEQITVDHLKHEVGEEVRFTPLAVSKDDGGLVSDRTALADAAVVGKVLKHFRGEKTESFQYRHKTGYRRHVGARQAMTLVEIESISVGGQTFTYTPAEEPEPAAVTTEEADAPKKVEAKAKPAKSAKSKSAKSPKSTAAKKPAAKKSTTGPRKPLPKKK